MALNNQFVLAALLQYNFLPNQSLQHEEMPLLLSSESFDAAVARKLVSLPRRSGGDQPGYDAVEYKLTRFNFVPRVCSIPHPRAYADLAYAIHDHWEHLEYIINNEASKLRPRQHDDGRLNIMNYGDRANEHRLNITRAFGANFVVHTDIANFYPSIYSHSVPWALVGIDVAKKDRTKQSRWYNKLDKAIQLTKRNETKGIAIGPATSNIISEVILARVDEQLKPRFKFTRFIDDYVAYCSTYDEAKSFLDQLGDALGLYQLTLNAGKTRIDSLPHPFLEDWVLTLAGATPKRNVDNPSTRAGIYGVVNFLNLAIGLAERTPDGSVLKYAARTMEAYLGEEINQFLNPDNFVDSDSFDLFSESSVKILLDFVINLAYFQPALLPVLEPLLEAAYVFQSSFKYIDHIRTLVNKYVDTRYSDAMAWALYYALKYDVPIDDRDAERIMEIGDCVAILLLFLSDDAGHKQRVRKFVNQLDTDDLYLLDRYWLLLYQMFFCDEIANPYQKETTFDVMKDNEVNFIRDDLIQAWKDRRMIW